MPWLTESSVPCVTVCALIRPLCIAALRASATAFLRSRLTRFLVARRLAAARCSASEGFGLSLLLLLPELRRSFGW